MYATVGWSLVSLSVSKLLSDCGLKWIARTLAPAIFRLLLYKWPHNHHVSTFSLCTSLHSRRQCGVIRSGLWTHWSQLKLCCFDWSNLAPVQDRKPNSELIAMRAVNLAIQIRNCREKRYKHVNRKWWCFSFVLYEEKKAAISLEV